MNDDSPTTSDRWQELLEDGNAIAAEYREEGWETLSIPTREVDVLTADPFGLDVLAPTEHFETLESIVEDATFDTSRVYLAEESETSFLIVVVEATAQEVAVVVPAYFDRSAAEPLRERALDEGRMYTHVEPPARDARVTFTHEDPTLFF